MIAVAELFHKVSNSFLITNVKISSNFTWLDNQSELTLTVYKSFKKTSDFYWFNNVNKYRHTWSQESRGRKGREKRFYFAFSQWDNLFHATNYLNKILLEIELLLVFLWRKKNLSHMRHNEGDRNIDASSRKRFKFMLLCFWERSNTLMMGKSTWTMRSCLTGERNWMFSHKYRVRSSWKRIRRVKLIQLLA